MDANMTLLPNPVNPNIVSQSTSNADTINPDKVKPDALNLVVPIKYPGFICGEAGGLLHS